MYLRNFTCCLCSATPIARALDLGADVVITGRCVDSALALGPLMHEVGGWVGERYLKIWLV